MIMKINANEYKLGYKYSVNFINEELVLSRLCFLLSSNKLIALEQIIIQEFVELRERFQIQNAEAIVKFAHN